MPSVDPPAAVPDDGAPRAAADRPRWMLAVLLAVTTCAFIDRAILNTVGQAVKDDLGLSDVRLGLLGGAAFSILYATLGIPVARLAERRDRVTIVTAAITLWSVMTLLCGMAGSFVHLMIARIGVGVGEAGANAPAQALLADRYPPHQRGAVIGILGLATPIGIVAGGIGGAWIAQHFGWRRAFMVAALPGLVLALVVRLTLTDTRAAPTPAAPVPALGAVVRRLLDSRGFRHLLVGGVLTNFVGQAVLAFGHPFLVRNFGLDYTEAAVMFALMNSGSVCVGFLVGGFGADRLGRRDVRFYGWLPGALILLAWPFYAFGFLQHDLAWAVVLLTIPGAFSASYYAPVLAVTQNLVDTRMRATAVSLVLLTLNVVGLLFGPLVTGWLSDHYAAAAIPTACAGAAVLCPAASAEGVRYALVTVTTLFVWSALHYLAAGRHLARELDLRPR